MAKAAYLQAKRRDGIAAYAGACRRHEASAQPSRKLCAVTTELPRIELRAIPDLFSALPA